MARVAISPSICPRATWPDANFGDWYTGWNEERSKIIKACRPTYLAASGSKIIGETDLPEIAKIESRHKKLADLMSTDHQMMMVRKPLRDLIEEFEPGIHQFWPIDVVSAKPIAEDPGPCFGLRVRQSHRSIVFEQSSLELHSGGGDDPETTVVPHINPDQLTDDWKLTIRKNLVVSSHLWCDFIMANHLMLSDALYAAIRGQDLKIWRCFKVEEV